MPRNAGPLHANSISAHFLLDSIWASQAIKETPETNVFSNSLAQLCNAILMPTKTSTKDLLLFQQLKCSGWRCKELPQAIKQKRFLNWIASKVQRTNYSNESFCSAIHSQANWYQRRTLHFALVSCSERKCAMIIFAFNLFSNKLSKLRKEQRVCLKVNLGVSGAYKPRYKYHI